MAKILAVDDSQAIRDLMTQLLSTENHEVITASDGVEAIRLARTTPVDMALVDVNMPNMNGLSLVSKLRKLETYKFIPILMVTTETDEYRKNKARSIGATGWLSKPITPERLLGAVNKLLA